MTYVDADEPLVDDLFDQTAPAAPRPPSPPAFAGWVEEAPPPFAPAPRLPYEPPVDDRKVRAPRQEDLPSSAARAAGPAADLPVSGPVQVHGVGFLSRWLTSNPVRVWLYGVLLAALAILVGKGLLSQEDSYLYAAAGAAVLGVPLTEAVRGSVYSPRGAAALLEQDRSAR